MAGKVEVEAEKTDDGAILSLKDVRRRRALQETIGGHNVTLSLAKLTKLGFPEQFMKDLERGYPVQFKMNEEAYLNLARKEHGGGSGRGGFPLADGLEGARRIDQKDYTHYVVDIVAFPSQRIKSGWSFKEDAEDAVGDGDRVYTRRHLKKIGIDPLNNNDWEGS